MGLLTALCWGSGLLVVWLAQQQMMCRDLLLLLRRLANGAAAAAVCCGDGMLTAMVMGSWFVGRADSKGCLQVAPALREERRGCDCK